MRKAIELHCGHNHVTREIVAELTPALQAFLDERDLIYYPVEHSMYTDEGSESDPSETNGMALVLSLSPKEATALRRRFGVYKRLAISIVGEREATNV